MTGPEPPIPGQQEIPAEDAQPDRSMCAWCGEPAVQTIELEPAQYTYRKKPNGKKMKLIKRHAIVAAVCLHHFSTLERGDSAA